jgi:hypothetical protein
MSDKSAPDTVPSNAHRRSPELDLLRAQVRFLEEMLIAKERMIGDLAREVQRLRKRAA